MRKRRLKKSKSRLIIILPIVFILILSSIAVLWFSNINENEPIENTNSSDSLEPDSTDTSDNNNSDTEQPSEPSVPEIIKPTEPLAPEFKVVTLNKQIPSGYTMGFNVDVGLTHGMDALFIQKANDKISMRFTAKFSGTVKNLTVYIWSYNGKPVVRVGIQEDDSGIPNGTWVNDNSFGIIELSNDTWFETVDLKSEAFLVQGNVYHIVIEANDDTFDGVAAVKTYRFNSYSQPFNHYDPDVTWEDDYIDSLSFDGKIWREENKYPIFVVSYSEGYSEGQPYSIIAPWVIMRSTWVGQTIIPASSYKVGQISFDVSIKASVPLDDLYYQIRDSSNTILSEGLFVKADQLSSLPTFVETTLSDPVVLQAGELYRLILLSPGTDLVNAYHIYGHEFCYNSSIGYGGLQHQLTSSYDGGFSWIENPDADAVFKIKTIE